MTSFWIGTIKPITSSSINLTTYRKLRCHCILQAGRSLVEYQSQAKQLFKKMNPNTPNKGSIETGPFLFQ